jgi:DUF4097 and DUF4098 domain-containing protein YvlB
MKLARSLATLAVLQLIAYSHAQDNVPATVTVKALPKTNASSKMSNTTNRVQYELRSQQPLFIASGQELEVRAMMANLVIGNCDASEPELIVVQTLWAMDEDEAKKSGEAHTLECKANANGVVVTSRLEKKESSSSNSDSRNVTLILSIPKTCKANLETSVGNITASGLDGATILTTRAGNISLENIGGAVTAKSKGGNVEARSITGELILHTQGGNVHVANIHGLARVVTEGGNFVAEDYSGKFTGSTGGGSIKLTLKEQPKEECQVKTGGGNIDLHLSKELKLNIKAATDVGRVTSPFSEKGRDRSVTGSKLSESLNGGGPLVHLSTSAGNVSIHYLGDSK